MEIEISKLEEIASMAHREAASGAPGRMVAVYVELALRHLGANHDDSWKQCTPCHRALGKQDFDDSNNPNKYVEVNLRIPGSLKGPIPTGNTTLIIDCCTTCGGFVGDKTIHDLVCTPKENTETD